MFIRHAVIRVSVKRRPRLPLEPYQLIGCLRRGRVRLVVSRFGFSRGTCEWQPVELKDAEDALFLTLAVAQRYKYVL